MITVLAAALSLGANANTITWGMNDDGFFLSSLQSISSQAFISGDVIFILLDAMKLEDGQHIDVCIYMKGKNITSFNDVNIQPSILGVWEADIFDDETPDIIFSTGDLGPVDSVHVQLVVLFLGSDTINENYYLTIPNEIIEVSAGEGIITFQEFDPDLVWVGYYFFYNIPEPGTGLLALVGASALLLRRRKPT